MTIEAHRTLLFDRDNVVTLANRAGISIVAIEDR